MPSPRSPGAAALAVSAAATPMALAVPVCLTAQPVLLRQKASFLWPTLETDLSEKSTWRHRQCRRWRVARGISLVVFRGISLTVLVRLRDSIHCGASPPTLLAEMFTLRSIYPAWFALLTQCLVWSPLFRSPRKVAQRRWPLLSIGPGMHLLAIWTILCSKSTLQQKTSL